MSTKRASAGNFLFAIAFLALAAPSFALAATQCACFFNLNGTPSCDLLSGETLDEADCTQRCTLLATGGKVVTSHVFFDENEGQSQAAVDSANQCTAQQAGNPPPTAQPPSGQPSPITFTKPRLAIDIPGVSFSDPLLKDNKLTIPFLGEYLSGVYKFLLGASPTIAIVMVMVGGVQYAISGATGDVESAKLRIKNAVTGLLLLFGVYVILYTINPQLTIMKDLELENIRAIPESEPDSVVGTLATGFARLSGDNLVDWSPGGVASEFVADLQAVATKLKTSDNAILITSTLRTVDEQIALINRNCQNPPGSATCNPKDGRPQTCILKDNKPENCPHTTGRAMDIWGAEKNPNNQWQQCVGQSECIADKPGCFANPCQKALIDAMKTQGFCVLSSEPWHFEKPKMSSNCN